MFDDNIKRLKDLRTKNQELVDQRFDEFVSDLKRDVNGGVKISHDVLGKLGVNKNRDIFYLFLIYVAILLYALVICIPDYLPNLGLLIFGFVFFVAGMQIGFGKETRGFGLIFAFSHGGTGLGCIIASLLMDRIDVNMLSDLSGPRKMYLFFTIALGIIAYLGMVLYNLSDTIHLKKYSKVVILLFFALVIFLVGMLPVIHF